VHFAGPQIEGDAAQRAYAREGLGDARRVKKQVVQTGTG
jgi:hypothetical protein